MNGFYSFPPILTHLLELLILALLLLIATGLGLRLLRLLRVYDGLSLGERLLFSLALGLGALALLMFAMGLLGVINLPAGLLVLAALAAGSFAPLREKWAQCRASIRPALQELRYPPNFFLATIILLAVGTALIKALAPVATQDDLMYHLALPRRYIEAHSIAFYPDSTYSGFPQLMEMLYTWGLLLGSDRISVLLAFSAGMIGPAAAALFAKRHISPNQDGIRRALPLLCAAIFLSMPLVGFVLRAANTDLTQASFDFLAIYAFIQFVTRNKTIAATGSSAASRSDPPFHEESHPSPNCHTERSEESKMLAGHPGLLTLAGIFAGLSFATKYYGVAIAGLISLALLFVWTTNKRSTPQPHMGMRALAVFFIAMICVAAPWLLRNLFVAGNPVWPLAGSLFGGLYISPESPPQSPETLLGSAPGISWDTPWTALQFMWEAMTRGPVTIDNQAHNVVLGFLVLPALLLLPVARRNAAIWWLALFALGYWLSWAFFFSRTSARYLSTFYLLCAVVGAYGIVSLAARFQQPILRILLGAIVGVLLLAQVAQSAASLGYYLPATFAFDRAAEDQYLAAYMEDYPMLQYIEANTPPTAVIYVWDGQPRGYRLPRPYVYARLVPLYTGFGSPPGQWRARLRELVITHILTHDRDRLAPGQTPGQDPFAEAANAFKEQYFGPLLFADSDYALYELK